MNQSQIQDEQTTASILRDYILRKGVADELYDRDGSIRPVWKPLIDYLSALTTTEIEEHFQRGNAYLRDAGVYFRQYSQNDAPERDWPLSHVPVLIDADEWAEICTALAQRADLFEQIMADLYGQARLVQDGHLPAELVAQNPQWLRPLVGVKPASGHYLHLLAFEISRNPDGSWFVIGDRTQAPSGAGFALENRMANMRIFSDPFPKAHIRRLAGFFGDFRDVLENLSERIGGQPAILTPGPNNDIYFEHTFIARYLGLMLLEGEDMIVQDGRLMVRTTEGPVPLGALWRRLDSQFADPLELDPSSFLGTPGMVTALREERLAMVNALGSGILEMRALMAFLPRISEALNGEAMKMPNIATWWCGEQQARDYVRDNADRMVIGRALAQDLLVEAPETLSVDLLADPKRAAWLVAQEQVTLSTSPAYEAGKLVPRPVTIRVTAVRTKDGWRFMPGGFARIGSQGESTVLAMQKGGAVADVWVMDEGKDNTKTLFAETGLRRRDESTLPARAAENLFWLGRYVERVETTIRLLRAYHLRLAETGDTQGVLLRQLATHLTSFGVDVQNPVPRSLVQMIAAARNCAGKVRDRFSIDGWSALGEIARLVEAHHDKTNAGDDAVRLMGELLHKITGFTGLVHENMYRSSGWNFLAFGRALERTDGLSAVLSAFLQKDTAAGAPDIALEVGDNVMAHRRRYHGEATPQSVMDLLVCDPVNPRAILFQMSRMNDLALDLPRANRDARHDRLRQVLLPMETRLSVADPLVFGATDLDKVRKECAQISDLLSSIYFR